MLNFNEYEKSSVCDPVVKFVDEILRGMAQILFCYHPVSGLFFLIGTFALSTQAGIYCLSALIVATAVARWFQYDAHLIHAGFYTYNAALIGIFWLYLGEFNLFSYGLMLLGAAVSVIMQHFLLRRMTERGYSLPTGSIAAVLVVWGGIVISYITGLIGYPMPIESLFISPHHFFYNPDYEFIILFFKDILGGLILFLLGILFNSRISFGVAVGSLAIGIIMALFFGGNSSIYWSNLFYNIVPLSIAFGGIFFVLNLNSIIYALISVIASSFLLFFLHHLFQPFGFPIIVLPFNIVLVIWMFPFFKGIQMEKFLEIYRVPLLVCKTPESIISWNRERKNSNHYWEKLKMGVNHDHV